MRIRLKKTPTMFHMAVLMTKAASSPPEALVKTTYILMVRGREAAMTIPSARSWLIILYCGAKGKTLLLATACASLAPSTSAFTVVPVRGPAHVARTSSSCEQTHESSALSSSPNGDDNDNDNEVVESKTKTIASPSDSIGMVSPEQADLETLEVEEDLLSTTAIAPSKVSSTPSAEPTPTPGLFMDVDGNGTGAR